MVAHYTRCRISRFSCLVAVGLGIVCVEMTRQAFSTDQDPADQAAQSRFFETEIRPILATRCYSCHGASKQKGSLRLDGLATILTGGESGPAGVPGKPSESLLIEAINYESFEMPP